jgi:hypothetical protein
MTPITELQEILNAELYDFKVKDFTHKQAVQELKSADQAKSLADQFKSLLKVVNRYHNPTDKEIKQGLLKHSQVLKLIKTINRPADKNLQEVYELAVTEFNNQIN